MMAFVFLRILAELLTAVGAGAAILILLGIGHEKEAVRVAVIAAIIIWIVRPTPEQRADFAAFQKARQPWTPPEN